MSFRTYTIAPTTKSDQNARSEVLWTAESRFSSGLANRTCTLVGASYVLRYRLSAAGGPSSRATGHATAGPIYVMRMCFLR